MLRQLWNWLLGEPKDADPPEFPRPPIDEQKPYVPLDYVEIEESGDFWSLADLDFWQGRLRR